MTLQQIERNWLLARVNIGSGQVTNDQLKRTYFNTQSFTGTLPDQEKQFLRKAINDNGKTPSSNYTGTLLIEALVALGVEPTKFINKNWRRLFLNYSP